MCVSIATDVIYIGMQEGQHVAQPTYLVSLYTSRILKAPTYISSGELWPLADPSLTLEQKKYVMTFILKALFLFFSSKSSRAGYKTYLL